MKVYGLIGYPLTHSFSQKYFTEKFQREGIRDCRYEAYPIKSVDEVKKIIKENPELRGLNITIPYKQSIFNDIDNAENIPDGLNACNCIRIVNGKTFGYNTDIIGFEQTLLPNLQKHHTHALVLGNGGAAKAVKFVLKKLNISYKIVSRKQHDDTDLSYDQVDNNTIKENLLIINTTPLGTFPNLNECPDLPYVSVTPRHLLYDLVYNPERTLFLQKGEEQGAAIKNGYDMLVLQAEESWRIWNSIRD